MDLPIKALIFIALALIVVLLVIGAVVAVFGGGGNEINKANDELKNQWECVMNNKDDAASHCQDETSIEFKGDDAVEV